MRIDTFQHLFMDLLRDIYSAESQLLHALPKVALAASNPDLKKAIRHHERETKEQVKRLKVIFNWLGEKATGETCEAMKGLIQECNELVRKKGKSPIKDAGLIASCQRIEHYEIAVYGTARAYANQLGFDDIAELLQASLDEEGGADKALTKLAEGGFLTSGINREALVLA